MKLQRDISKARKAFVKKDVKMMKDAHNSFDPNYHKKSGKYIKSIVYGGLDGIITTFAVVAGVVGAGLSSSIILVMGFANLFSDGFSMGVGDYLSSKSEKEYYYAERKREKWEVDNYPRGEKNEMIELYMKKGLSKKDATTMINILSKKKKYWIDTMMNQELDLVESKESPLAKGTISFLSFLVFGIIPLSLYILSFFLKDFSPNFLLVSIFTGIALFILGMAKTKITEKNILRSGVETLIIGGIASGIAYGVGYLVSGLL